MVEILNPEYAESPLNPLLKIVIFVILLVVVLLYSWAYRDHSGKIRSFAIMLFFFALFVALGALFRYFGHGTDLGFDKDYSMKWFQSLAYLIGAIFFALAGRKMATI